MSKINQIFSEFCSIPPSKTCHGVTEEVLAPLTLRRFIGSDCPLLVLVPRLSIAERLEAELLLWMRETDSSNRSLILMPDPPDRQRINPETEILRTRIAHQFSVEPYAVTIGTPQSVFSPVIPHGQPGECGFEIRVGDHYSINTLLTRLVEMDYDDELEVNLPGEFSRRGGIIDLFSPSSENPLRIEFFGDEIETMRLFSVRDQRTVSQVSVYHVASRPKPETVEGDDLWDCMMKWRPRVLIIFPDECDTAFMRFGDSRRIEKWHNFSTDPDHFSFWEGVDTALSDEGCTSDCQSMLETVAALPSETGSAGLYLARRMIADSVRHYADRGYTLCATVPDGRNTAAVRAWTDEYQLSDLPMDIYTSGIPSGVIFHSTRHIILTEREIFYTPHRRQITLIPQEGPLLNSSTLPDHFAELDEGDYAVHLLHGVARFIGIRELTVDGVTDEVMELEFDDDAKLFVPIWQAGLVSRYAGTGKNAPKLNRLSGHRWDTMKVEALAAMKKLAAELLRLQAARAAVSGESFPPDLPEQSIFEASFPYRETPDQLRAIAETKQDMESEKPMDRLICGDVGYGKTEVAVRAVFKAVMSGKQAAVLVPTTILAQQHYYTLSQRFSEYPVVVEVLSRFRSPAEHRDVLRRLKAGAVDVVIGTHRLIQSDVHFFNLGLVVIDEEQRFGVEHKERLKKMRTAVDILTLSATPIPRTLYMSMTGLRDLSTIMTPPERRLPVETIVAKPEKTLIHEVIRREIQRGGQVFFLHNRVRSIHKTCAMLQNLVPEARFAVGHGQMEEGELEQVMSDFIDGKADVLVCTTIIESGVDIPNVNTIIIDDAHRFGLSELYQLRGRVGRWTRQAYAYLLLPEIETLTSDARKRMSAIRKYTQLGSGFRLAMRDLEIRGSGNLLGAEQSGHIANLGFDLYCRLLRETVARIKKEPVPILPDAELKLDFLRFAVNAPKGILSVGIPVNYVPSLRHRIDFYRQLAYAGSDEVIDSIEVELRDRCGPLPETVKLLLIAFRIKLSAAECGFRAVIQWGNALRLERSKDRFYRDENDSLPLISGRNPVEKLHSVLFTLRSLREKKT